MLSFFQWIEATSLAMTINNSKYAFALIESFHLLSLAIIGGAVLVVDARLLGLGFRNQKVSEVAAAARPWLIGSLIGILLTGVLMFSSLAAGKYYYNPGFWWKMYFLAAAIVFTFAVRQPYVMRASAVSGTPRAAVIAIVSTGLYLGVAVFGRAIGFL
ncbi:MAG: DUF6644 family protein [Gammaproteobacteria bacterium]